MQCTELASVRTQAGRQAWPAVAAICVWAATAAVCVGTWGAQAQRVQAADDAAAPPDAAAGEAPPKGGLGALVRVTLPLAAGDDAALKQSITRARDRLVQAAKEAGDGRRPTLVLEISPASGSKKGGAGSE